MVGLWDERAGGGDGAELEWVFCVLECPWRWSLVNERTNHDRMSAALSRVSFVRVKVAEL